MTREVKIALPTLFQGQKDIWHQRQRLNVARCGRRYGKTKLMVAIASYVAGKGGKAGLFAPEHKQLSEPYREVLTTISPIKVSANKNEGTIRTISGGIADFWALNDNPLAGRGREYDMVLIDEAAFTKNGEMLEIWEKSIKPTLLTRRGSAFVFSTPFGVDPDNFFYKLCHDKEEMGFHEFHAPTSSNPYVPADELEKEREKVPPLVFRQEYEAEFIDWSGVAFFGIEKMMDGKGQPLAYPKICDTVFATIDTAVKDGKEHDGTAVIYWALSKHIGNKLVILDYDKIQIQGSLLESWLPSVYERLSELERQCGARMPNIGVFIEDKASGTILLQQASRRGWQATAIDSKLTSVGKDERAISVSGYVYQGLVKISQFAYDKLITFKGQTRNHLLTEVLGFRVGDKDAHKRADDLVDCYCYGIAIALGNIKGY